MTAIAAALERLTRACVHVSAILDEGERDPRWAESNELEAAAIEYGRAVRNSSADAGAEPPPISPGLASPATFPDDIPWPSKEENDEINRRNFEDANRYPIIEMTGAPVTRYVDWYSRTHDDLIARALDCRLVAIGETVRVGWVCRDASADARYSWLGERVVG